MMISIMWAMMLRCWFKKSHLNHYFHYQLIQENRVGELKWVKKRSLVQCQNAVHLKRNPTRQGSNLNARYRNQYLDSVLNPVENLTQWKTVKTRSALPLHQQDKENINVEKDFGLAIINPEPSLELLNKNAKTNVDRKKFLDPEIAVDASLSSWLAESETTPLSKGSSSSVGNSASGQASSPRNHEGRHILGALTMNPLKQVSTSSSPKRARSQNPKEMPIIGTVGSYWRHTGQTTDSDSSSSSNGMLNTRSKSGEVERLDWNSTPFEEARLERALDRKIAQVDDVAQYSA